MDQISQADFERLYKYMKDRYGLNLEKKKVLVEGRLQAVYKEKKFESITAYLNHVFNDASGAESGTLLTRLTTNFTYFWREVTHYTYLLEKGLPQLIPTIGNKDLCVWSAACSSGQEPYTIAMTLDQYFKGNKAGWDTTVLATDISPFVLQQATDAVYGIQTMEGLPPEYVQKYFKKLSATEYKISDAIRSEVVFRSFNLMDTHIPFRKKFHIIFCRNCMIYFDNPTRLALMRRFYDVLVPGGIFIIGLSETIARGETKFEMVQPSIYRKPESG